MSSQTSPNHPVHAPTSAVSTGMPSAQASVEARTGIDPPGVEDEFPFESSEFGVGGFLPHLDQADGGAAQS